MYTVYVHKHTCMCVSLCVCKHVLYILNMTMTPCKGARHCNNLPEYFSQIIGDLVANFSGAKNLLLIGCKFASKEYRKIFKGKTIRRRHRMTPRKSVLGRV